jgi:alpha-amylase
VESDLRVMQVYYGQEIGLSGGEDPENREALWDYGYHKTRLPKKLNAVRQVAMSTDEKFAKSESVLLYHDDYQMFYRKRDLLVGLNGQGTGRKIARYDLRVRGTKYSAGEVLVEVLSCERVVSGRGEVVVRMKNGDPVVLYPVALLKGTGICGL